MTDDKVHYRKLSYQVIGCAMNVHADLGPGFPEAVYHQALIRELIHAKIPFETQKDAEVFYKGHMCGEFRMDFVINGQFILELKALKCLIDEHVAQVISYLKATGLHLGILLNFGSVSLESKRVVR
jgi:GxxExxY protein